MKNIYGITFWKPPLKSLLHLSSNPSEVLTHSEFLNLKLYTQNVEQDI